MISTQRTWIDRLTLRSFLWQFLFWIPYVTVWYFIFAVDAQNDRKMLQYLTISFAIGQIVQANLTNYWLIPNFFYRRRYLTFFFLVVLIAASSAQFVYLVVDSLPGELRDYSATYDDWMDFFAVVIVISFFINSVVTALRLGHDKYKDDLIAEQLQKDKLVEELKFLKAQINPHFLFNTINTVFHLIDQDAEQSKSLLVKFSEILRYHLYQSADEMVPLSKEIDHVNNYVEMERLRKGDILKVDIDIDISLGYFEIAPLILLSFVENAFKHVSTDMYNKNWIYIYIVHKDGALEILVENSIKKQIVDPERKGDGGIGLTNIRRRLELIYGSDHSLHITDNGEVFKVLLKIEIL